MLNATKKIVTKSRHRISNRLVDQTEPNRTHCL